MAKGTNTHAGQVREVCKFVRMQRAGFAWKTHQSGKVRGDKGLPDVFCIVPVGAMAEPRAFWVEVKVGRDKLSPEQIDFKRVSEAAGIPVVVGRVGDVADFLGL